MLTVLLLEGSGEMNKWDEMIGNEHGGFLYIMKEKTERPEPISEDNGSERGLVAVDVSSDMLWVVFALAHKLAWSSFDVIIHMETTSHEKNIHRFSPTTTITKSGCKQGIWIKEQRCAKRHRLQLCHIIRN